jgi:hypothetical protein
MARGNDPGATPAQRFTRKLAQSQAYGKFGQDYTRPYQRGSSQVSRGTLPVSPFKYPQRQKQGLQDQKYPMNRVPYRVPRVKPTSS